MTNNQTLDFYRRPGLMTEPGSHAAALEALPRDLQGLVQAGHGLQIHEHIAPAYGVEVSPDRRVEVHIRRLDHRLDRLLTLDPAPLSEARPLAKRLVGDCRHYSLLIVGALRLRGIPARARCGFGAYFEPGEFVDHWVCEYWNEGERRWVLVDSQIDGVQENLFHTSFNLLDVPRDEFLVAGDAWTLCRAGKADPARFGVMDMRGLWFTAGNLVRDVAALNNVEMLPWDVWGAMAMPGETLDDERLAFFDRIASLTHEPDQCLPELREIYAADERLSVPDTVFNAVLNQMEAI